MQTLTPATVDEMAAALRDTAAGTVAFRGGGTKSAWGAARAPAGSVVDTTGLARVVEHAAGDFVVTVEAGTLLSEVQRVVGEAGQWLALDPPEVAATIGGVVATAASGPRRLRFGTPRDLLIGITVVLADGTVAESGGKVVKNVAGYDLGKLFCGSFGTLGAIARCTLRLHPRPRSVRVVSVELDDPGPTVRMLRRSALRPSAVEYDGTSLHVVVETFEAAADAQAEQVQALVGGQAAAELPAGFGARPWKAGQVGVKLAFRLGALSEVLALARRLAPDAALSSHAASGVLWLGGDLEPGTIRALRDGVTAYDGTAVVVEAPASVKEAVDVWGPVRGLAVMRRIKEQFDPERRLQQGVFVDGC